MIVLFLFKFVINYSSLGEICMKNIYNLKIEIFGFFRE